MTRAVSRAILLLVLSGPAAAMAGTHESAGHGGAASGRAAPQAQRPGPGGMGGSARPEGLAAPRPGTFGPGGQERALDADARGPRAVLGRGPFVQAETAPRGGQRGGGEVFASEGRPAFGRGGPSYRVPAGYGGWVGHGWRRGEVLPAAFFAPGAVIGDWWDFGLFQPDEGLEWIRVGADAVLVDLATGQVVDVAPGVY